MSRRLALSLLCVASVHVWILSHWDKPPTTGSKRIAIYLMPTPESRRLGKAERAQQAQPQPQKKPATPTPLVEKPSLAPVGAPFRARTNAAAIHKAITTQVKTRPTQHNPTTKSTTPAAAPSASSATETHSAKPEAAPDPALLRLIRQAVEARKHYPRRARRRSMEGRAVIRFALSPDGEVSDLEIRRASGHRLLDRAAADAVRGIAPLAGAGRYLARTRIVELGVEFRLR